MIDAFEIPCRDLLEMLTDYIEGALEPIDVERVDAHLSVCPPCVHVLEQLRRTMELAGELRDVDVEGISPDVRAELLNAFSSQRRSER